MLSAYLAAKQSHEVKECILLLQSSLKRIGKQVPARPLTLLPCGGVRLRRRSSWIKLLRVGSLAADMRRCTLLDTLAECSICMEMSHNHHNMCPHLLYFIMVSLHFFPCMIPPLRPLLSHFPFSIYPFLSLPPFLLFFPLPPTTAPSHAIYLIYTLTHPDDRNRCTINYALKYISSVLRFPSPYHCALSANASLHCIVQPYTSLCLLFLIVVYPHFDFLHLLCHSTGFLKEISFLTIFPRMFEFVWKWSASHYIFRPALLRLIVSLSQDIKLCSHDRVLTISLSKRQQMTVLVVHMFVVPR